MIVVTGATGQLGRGIAEALVARVGADRVAVSVRDPQKAADLAARGVRVRQGDFASSDSLRSAFAGATQVLMVSSNAAAQGDDPLAQHQTAIAAARAAGARRIVYTSHMAASAASAFPPMLDHDATERMLRASGLAWTALRNGFYAASGVMFMGDIAKTGAVEGPQDGKVSWTAHADLAEAAAAVLADEGRFDGPTPPLTASEALDLADLARIAGEVLGRTTERKLVSEDDLRARMLGWGAPPARVEIVLGFYRASHAGELATVDPTLEQLLGRRPIAMREVIAQKLGG